MKNMSDSIFLRRTFNESEQLAVDLFYDRRFPTVVMLILFSIVGIPGNIIVLLVYFKGRLTTTQFLISVIAMVDLFAAGVAIPFSIVYQTSWFSILDITFCKMSKTSTFIGTYPGVYLIWGLSVVRYYHVCRPHELYFVETKVRAFCVFIFGISLFFGGCIYVMMGKQTWAEKELPAYYCNVADDYKNGVLHRFTLVVALVSLLFCLISIVIMYCLILRRVLKQQNKMIIYKNNTLNKCEQLLAKEVDRNRNAVFTDQCDVSFISTVTQFIKSDSSIVSHDESDKQTYTTIEQRTDKVEDPENILETSTSLNKSSISQNIIFPQSSGFPKTMLVAIIGSVYVLTYVPWISITIYLTVNKLPRTPFQDLFKYGFNPGLYLFYLGCAVNPVVYTFVDPIFRSKCKAIFQKTDCDHRLHK